MSPFNTIQKKKNPKDLLPNTQYGESDKPRDIYLQQPQQFQKTEHCKKITTIDFDLIQERIK
jgi:hypothetical protein